MTSYTLRVAMKIELEKKIDDATKDRVILFRYLEKEPRNTQAWRVHNGLINHNTRKIGVLREKWREINNSK
mgnify:CR=1 FL=1